MKVLLLYLPVLHRGYLDLLGRHQEVDQIWLVGDSLLEMLDPVVHRKDLRRLTAETSSRLLAGLTTKPVVVLDLTILTSKDLSDQVSMVIVNEDEMMRELVGRLGLEERTFFDGAFLRWDRKRIREPDNDFPVKLVTSEDLTHLSIAQGLATRSPDWWLQVGVCIVGAKENGHVLQPFGSFNYHPLRAPDYFGDPRFFCKAGEDIETSTALHAEARLIDRCARLGVSLEGALLYTTTFPCGGCARDIAEAGFSRCYFVSGYSNLLGAEVLSQQGVELFRLTFPVQS